MRGEQLNAAVEGAGLTARAAETQRDDDRWSVGIDRQVRRVGVIERDEGRRLVENRARDGIARHQFGMRQGAPRQS